MLRNEIHNIDDAMISEVENYIFVFILFICVQPLLFPCPRWQNWKLNRMMRIDKLIRQRSLAKIIYKTTPSEQARYEPIEQEIIKTIPIDVLDVRRFFG